MRSILIGLCTGIIMILGLLVIAPSPQNFTAQAQAPQIDTASYYRLTNDYGGAGKSLDGSRAAPTLGNTGNNSEQLWKLTPLGNGKYRLTNAFLGEGKSLDTPMSGNNYVVTMADTGRFSGQFWTLTPLGNGKYRLTNDYMGPGKSLDSSQTAPTIGNTGNYSGQIWTLTKLNRISDDASSEDGKVLCWKQSFGRGVGTVPTDCPAGTEKQAGLCYPKCRDGYTGIGPVCWQNCPSGSRDDGAYCAKPEPYGRGAGFPWQFGDALNDSGMFARCEAAHGRGNCEKNGLIVYPKCRSSFHAVGCCVCSPDCQAGMTDIGVSCQKNSYGRGAGTIPGCGSGLQLDAGLCYNPCPRDFTGVGPVCWGKCPPEFPFECGAGCARNQAACATAVTDMTLNTVSVAINLLSFVAGGPGVTVAAQKAAASAMNVSTARFVGMGAKEMGRQMVWAVKSNAKVFAKDFVKAYAKGKLDPQNLRWSVAGALRTGGLFAANQAAKEFAGLKTSGEFDWEMLKALDPTGIASMVTAFTKYGNCNMEVLAADVEEIDFGSVTAPTSDVKIVRLTVQVPTTITEITTTPYIGSSISAETDCLGKVLQPGERCDLKVRVSGQSKMDGEVRIYTTQYDVIPFSIGVKANGNAPPATIAAGVEDAVNLTSIVGVWAWMKNHKQKVIVQADGTALIVWLAGQRHSVTVKDSVKRVYEFKWSGSTDILTLSEDRQELSGQSQSGIPVSALKLTWDPRCNAGELFFAGLCYDVPPDYQMTAPGFMGKPCPANWRDDGTSCWPAWTGVDVAVQASRTGAFQYPIVVTDCVNYAQTKGQRCPANFKNTGGPAGCSCEAQPTSKEVKSIIGTIPVK